MELVFDTIELLENIKEENETIFIERKSSNLKVFRKPKRGRPTHVELPKQIKITLEMVGLIVGEGHLSRHQFIIANAEEKVIEVILEFVSQFNHKIGTYIEVCTKGTEKEFPEKCKRFWEERFDIHIRYVRECSQYFNTTEGGVLHVELNNTIIDRLITYIVTKSKIAAENDKELAIGYLRGVFAGEGNINSKKKDGCVYMLRISAKKIKDRDHYKRCLNTTGINITCKDMPTISKEEGIQRGWTTTKGRAGAVLISRWENFVKVINLELLSLHPKKEKTFFKNFKNNQFTKQFLEFEEFIGKEFTQKEVQLYFKFKGRHVSRLHQLCKQGFAERKQLNNDKKTYTYWLNDNYIKLHQILKECFKSESQCPISLELQQVEVDV